MLEQLANSGINGGYMPGTHYSQFANTLLVCATEMRTEEEIMRYANTLKSIMS